MPTIKKRLPSMSFGGFFVSSSFFCKGCVIGSDGNYAIVYKACRLFIHEIKDNKLIKTLKLPVSFFKRQLARIHVLERALHITPRNGIFADGEFVFAFSGAVYSLSLQSFVISSELILRDEMNSPLSFCKVSDSKNHQDKIFFGEYFENTKHEPVRIFLRSNRKWSVAYTFPSGEIKHIHSISYIEKSHCFLIATGDSQSESSIYITYDDFSSVQVFLGHSERYRTCSLVDKNNFLYFCGDSTTIPNFLCKVDTNDLREVANVAQLPGPVIYSLSLPVHDLYFFSTTVEPAVCSSRFKYFLSFRLAASIENNYSHFFVFDETGKTQELCSFKKDAFAPGLFGFGAIKICKCDQNSFFLSFQGITKRDNRSFILKVSKKENRHETTVHANK